MRIREPAKAGMFYPGSADRCQAEVTELVRSTARLPENSGALVGGIVPHAGWTFSGAVAGRVFATLAAADPPDVIVLFGAVHLRRGKHAWVFGSGCWQTPLGRMEIDDRLAERILGHTNLIVDDPYAHEQEHSIEVQIPLIQAVMPHCKLVPILVPPIPTAPEVGDAVARTVEAYGYQAAVVGSTDLTHYGPSYGMTPHGAGSDGLLWAKEINDRRMIDLMAGLDAERVVAEASENHNACGAGAVAATIAAARTLGATRGILLDHVTSADVMPSRSTQDAVGYAGMVFAVA